MISIIMLYLEILLDLTGLIAGIIVLVRSSDRGIQRAWGLLAISLSSLLLYDNIEWIVIFSRMVEDIPHYMELPMDHLSLWHTVRTVVFFQLFSLFPIGSLKPGWMTLSRIVNFLIPVLLIICIAWCYEKFNGQYTDLKSFDDIRENIHKQDVIIRLALFIVSVITPSINFLFPYLKRWIPFRRKQSKAMTIYMGCFAVIMSGYIWLMLGTTGLSFNLFGYFVIVPTIYLNILYMCDENPLSLPPLPVEDLQSEEIEAIKEIEVSPAVLEISNHLQILMKEKAPFTNPQYSLQNLLDELDTNENRLNKALHYDGFSGFRDYINFQRLQYFKEQATLNKENSVKELMFKSGFTSRSSFYRYFAQIEKMSPSEYIEMLKNA